MKTLPKIRLRWIRGHGGIEFNRPHTFLNLGQRGSGKSALLESCALHYEKVIDLYGSRDAESLAWCRSDFADSMLFVVGDSVRVACSWPVKKASELTLKDIRDHRVIVSSSPFYGSLDEEFRSLNRVIYDVLYHRTTWVHPWFLMVREASNFIYARIKITKNQQIAKADFIYLLREARHMGYAVGVDTIRWTSIDKEIRDVSDYLFIKRVGIQGLPRDLRFVYRYVDPASLMNPFPPSFVLVCNRGPIAIGRFEKPAFHKEEGENVLRKFGIEIEYGEPIDYGEGTHLSDFDHAKLVEAYVDHAYKLREAARALKRSPQTVTRHIEDHRLAVVREGTCARCRRVDGREASNLLDRRASGGGPLGEVNENSVSEVCVH